MVDRLSNLIGIFQKPELDFSQNRALRMFAAKDGLGLWIFDKINTGWADTVVACGRRI